MKEIQEAKLYFSANKVLKWKYIVHKCNNNKYKFKNFKGLLLIIYIYWRWRINKESIKDEGSDYSSNQKLPSRFFLKYFMHLDVAHENGFYNF